MGNRFINFHEIVKIHQNLNLILNNVVEVAQFVAIVFLWVDDTVYNDPVFFEEITLVNVVGEERKSTEELFNFFAIDLTTTEENISTSSSY